MFKLLFIGFYFFLTSFIFSQDSLIFVIRVDDIQSRNTAILPRSIKHFQQAVELRGGKITWAIIPHRLIETQNQNGILSNEIRQSIINGHEAAMHGYNHICQLCSQSSHEMFCTTNNFHFSYAQQSQLITNGLKIMLDTLGIIPNTFVPPGHKADTITYQVLIDKGFKWLSSTGGTKKFIYKTLYNLQQNNEYTWQLTAAQYTNKLNQALADIRNVGSANGYYCLLLHDPFIRQGYENGIVVRWIGELLDSLNNFYQNRIKYLTLNEAAQIFLWQTPTNISTEINNPSEFVLFQNYPNPFNPSTKIRYSLSCLETQCIVPVQLKIYDVLGNELATLVNEEQSQGTFEIEFKTASGVLNLASGIYFYRLQAGCFTKTKKMILLR